MPTTDLISPFVVSCAGGLTLNKDVFSMQPGEALLLQNFEPDIKGGYRRVSGTTLYNSTMFAMAGLLAIAFVANLKHFLIQSSWEV